MRIGSATNCLWRQPFRGRPIYDRYQFKLVGTGRPRVDHQSEAGPARASTAPRDDDAIEDSGESGQTPTGSRPIQDSACHSRSREAGRHVASETLQ